MEVIAVFDMSAPVKRPKLGKQPTLHDFFEKISSAGESSEGREVILIEDEEEIREVSEEREALVLEGCSGESLPLQKVRDIEGGNEAGPSSSLQPWLTLESVSEGPPILSDSSSSEPDSELDIAESIECVASGVPTRADLRISKSKVSHRRSGFDRSWLKEFPWLIYNKDERSMYCKLYIKYGKLPRNGTGKWVRVGASSLRHDKVRNHELSAMHRDSEYCRREEARASLTGGIRGALEVTVTRKRKSIIGALKCLYYLAKNELPHTTNFSSLIDLCVNMGCDYMKELHQGGNASYRSEQVISEFLFSLSDTIRQEVMSKMRNSPTISLMIDESTDVSVLKQLVVYGRSVVDGKLECHFLGMRDLPDGRASTIEKSVLDFLHDNRLEIGSVSSFGSDGASVMTGCREGVATRLKRLNNNIISIHCVAHRLALAAGQASQSIPYLRRFKEILSTLFYFYHNSAVRQVGLTAIQVVLNDPVLRLKQAKDVRWLSHHAAVEALRRSLVSVLTSLDREVSERSEPTASGLLNFLKKYFFIAALSLFADVLPFLSKLSRTLQSSSLDFSILQPVVDSCISNIVKQANSPGKYFTELDEVIATLNEAGHSVSVLGNIKEQFDEQVRKPYLCKLAENMKDRFQSIDIISAFSIFNPSELPSTESELAHYGESELNTLLSHYSNGPLELNRDNALSEWKEFKVFFSQPSNRMQSIKEVSEFCLCSSERRQLFPIMAELIARGLILPIATADCERGFSALNRIKTCPRNRLKTRTLEELMFISIEGPTLEQFDFAAAADK